MAPDDFTSVLRVAEKGLLEALLGSLVTSISPVATALLSGTGDDSRRDGRVTQPSEASASPSSARRAILAPQSHTNQTTGQSTPASRSPRWRTATSLS
jgi:hypothetical protein